MARPDKHSRIAARAQEKVHSLLERRRFGEAADALLTLPRGDRGFALATVAAGAQLEIDQAFVQQAQPSLLAWLARVEREPQLAAALGERTRFALFSAALRARMWPRAQALWDALRPKLREHAAFEGHLLAAIDSVVSTRGEPDAAVLAQLLAQDARLGHGDVRPRNENAYPAPQALEHVEPACLACFGSEPWSRFREMVWRWLSVASPAVAQRLRVLFVELSERELLQRARAGSAEASEVARWMASCALEAGAPSELEAQVALCLRVSARLAAAKGAAVKSCEALAVVASSALRYPALRPLIAGSVLGGDYGAAAAATCRELLRLAVAAEPAPEVLIAVAVELHVRQLHLPDDGDCPQWFSAAFEVALADPAALAAALGSKVAAATARGLDNPCAEPCHALLEVLPVTLAVRALDRVWEHADSSLRERLAAPSGLLLDRMRAPVRVKPSQGVEELRDLLGMMGSDLADAPVSQLKALMNSTLGQELLGELVAEAEGAEQPIAPKFEADARTLLGRVGAYNPEALEAALMRASDKAEVRRIAGAYLARASTLLARYRMLETAVRHGNAHALSALERHCCDGIVVRAADAAAALLEAESASAPRRLCNRFARLLLEEKKSEPDALEQPHVVRAVLIANRRVGKEKPRVQKTAKRAGAKKPAKAMSALRKPKAAATASEPSPRKGKRAAPQAALSAQQSLLDLHDRNEKEQEDARARR